MLPARHAVRSLACFAAWAQPVTANVATTACRGLHAGASQGHLCLINGPNNNAARSRPWTVLGARWLSSATAHGTLVAFPLAQTGEGISECELMQWHVKDGDVVSAFQPVCEVQSDKASIEITSRYSGSITRLLHKPGDVVKVGAALLHMHVTEGDIDPDHILHEDATASSAASSSSSSGSSSGGNGGEHGSGGAAPPIRRETIEVVVMPPPPPTLAGAALTSDFSGGGDGGAAAAAAVAAAAAGVRASPVVRRLARDLGVDLAAVAGSGPGGRVLREDVEAAAEAAAAAAVAALGGTGPLGVVTEAAGGAPAAMSASAAPMESTRVPIRGYRRAMVRSSTEAAAIPTFHFFDDVIMDPLMQLRADLVSDPELAGTKLTYLPFFMKALSLALVKWPEVNACLAPGGDELIQHHTCNIGVAMATGGGLVVPIVKQVESKNIPEIARELARLQQLAAVGKLVARDVSGGCVTISNIGSIGGTNATPMLNPPEAAIIALARTRPLPRYDPAGGGLVKQHVMGISWGGDHRVVDGATLAQFSNYWKGLVEQPARLLLHLR